MPVVRSSQKVSQPAYTSQPIVYGQTQQQAESLGTPIYTYNYRTCEYELPNPQHEERGDYHTEHEELKIPDAQHLSLEESDDEEWQVPDDDDIKEYIVTEIKKEINRSEERITALLCEQLKKCHVQHLDGPPRVSWVEMQTPPPSPVIKR